MKVVYWGKAKRFFEKYKEAKAPLKAWKKAVVEANWSDFTTIKQTFNSADWYEGLIIFDIKGNDYRLITVCTFQNGRVYIKEVLTHEEYDSGQWKVRNKRF